MHPPPAHITLGHRGPRTAMETSLWLFCVFIPFDNVLIPILVLYMCFIINKLFIHSFIQGRTAKCLVAYASKLVAL